VSDDSKALVKTPAKHWAHSFVERTTGEIAKATSSPAGMTPYVNRLGSTFGQAVAGTALAAGMGTTDAMFGKGAGDAVAGASAGLGLIASVALADSPAAAQWAATLGVGSLMCLVRSRTEKFLGGGSKSASAPGQATATDRIAAVAAKMGQTAPTTATEVSPATK
jgi:hypothetical protein